MNQTLVFSALLLVVFTASANDRPAANKAQTETAAVASGKQTYVEYCAVCHGPDGRGPHVAETPMHGARL